MAALKTALRRASSLVAAGAAAALVRLGADSHAEGRGEKTNFCQKLTSVAHNVHVDQFSLVAGSCSVRKETLHGGRQEGVDVITVDNGTLRFTVVPTRGMSVGELSVEGTPLGWSSPVRELVHPSHVDLQDHTGLGWLTGFNELMVRCGVAWNGHPGKDAGQLLSLHGRIGNIPASEVEVEVEETEGSPPRIVVRGRVDEAMFKFCDFELWTEVSTYAGSDSVQIRDRLVNRSSYEREYQMLYHANFGPPTLEKGATFVAAVDTVAPFNAKATEGLDCWDRYAGPTRGFGEHVFCVIPHADAAGMTTVGLVNQRKDRGVAVRYDTTTLPALTLWKNTDTLEEGYVTGIEPGTGFCCQRAVERQAGRVPTLPPGGSVAFSLEIKALRDKASVQAIQADIAEIHGLHRGCAPRVVTQPVSPS